MSGARAEFWNENEHESRGAGKEIWSEKDINPSAPMHPVPVRIYPTCPSGETDETDPAQDVFDETAGLDPVPVKSTKVDPAPRADGEEILFDPPVADDIDPAEDVFDETAGFDLVLTSTMMDPAPRADGEEILFDPPVADDIDPAEDVFDETAVSDGKIFELD